MKHKTIWILFIIVLAGGSFLRLWRLADRPMHTDEAVHAEKFGTLLEEDSYFYDPEEFHGPTLNYFTRVSSWLKGEATYRQIDEVTLRIVPAVFGVGLILTPFFFIRGTNWRVVFFSSVLIAFSPAFVYYSRYYIQEMLLVFFTACFLGCGWRYVDSRKLIWVVLSGVSVGLMHATKETFIFAVFAAILGMGFLFFYDKSNKFIRCSHLLTAVAAMVTTSVLFYSSFGTNPQGIIDSLTTYGVWIQRAGSQSVHVHPWYYYLNLLTWMEFIEPISWNEDGIVALAVCGLLFTFMRKTTPSTKPALLRFFSIYTLSLVIVYCLIPYKTPWCLLSFLFGMAILAGFAIDRLVGSPETLLGKYCVRVLLIIFVIVSPIVQSWCLSFQYPADPINPYVYAHTGTDIYTMVNAVKKAADTSKEGVKTPIQIIAAGDDYWPFPWYLRKFSQAGYWNHVDDSAPQSPIILANAKCEQKLLSMLYTAPPAGQKHLYVPLFDEMLQLRPGVQWRGYIRKDLWDQMHSQSSPPVLLEEKGVSILKVQPDKKKIDNLVKFSHRAMNANFEVFIQHDDGTYAGRAARDAFQEVDRLEGILSRFIENSDVARINQLAPGEFAIVDEDTMNCLRIARRGWQLTDGAFDVTIGDLIHAWKNNDLQKAETLLANRPSMKMLELTDDFSVKVLTENIRVDLGGIGKGYAVDKIAEILNEWGIKNALIHGGASSVLAMAPPEGKNGWRITLTNPSDNSKIASLEMKNEVLSCSGLQRGQHIINPFTGQPVADRRACWIRTKSSAALADALTTAGMIMPVEKIRSLREQIPEMVVMLLMSTEGQELKLDKIGTWPDNQ